MEHMSADALLERDSNATAPTAVRAGSPSGRRPSSGSRPKERVLESLRNAIASGEIPHGGQIESERVLAARFMVDRRTVRGALDLLVAEGLVRSNGFRLRFAESRPLMQSRMLDDTIAVLARADMFTEVPEDDGGWSRYIVFGAMRAIHRAGSHAMTVFPNEPLSRLVTEIIRSRPKGLVFPEIDNDDRADASEYRRMTDAGVALVLHGDDPEMADFDRVISDHETGAYELTKWLIAKGRKNIITLWNGELLRYYQTMRYAGYVRAMTEAGLDVVAPIVTPEEATAENDPKAARLMAGFLVEHALGPNGFDAIICDSDGTVPMLSPALKLFGKRPNIDVLMAGYDDYWPIAATRPDSFDMLPIATVNKHNIRIGETLVAHLFDRISGKLPKEPVRRLVSPTLVTAD
jgi:DNA-binding LacI/PurR family transcriptional regulator